MSPNLIILVTNLLLQLLTDLDSGHHISIDYVGYLFNDAPNQTHQN